MLTQYFPKGWHRNAVLWLVAAGMLASAAVAIYTYKAYQRAATQLLIERDQQVAILSAARLRTEMAKFSDLLLDLSRSPEIARGEVPAIQRALAEAALRLTIFDGGVLFLDTHGTVRAYQPSRREILGEDWSDREYFRSVLASMDVAYSDAVSDGPNSTTVIAVAVPVRGEQSQLVGILVGYFQLGTPVESSFYASMVRLRIGQAGRSFLIDGKGRILFDTQSERVGHFATTDQLAYLQSGAAFGAVRTSNPDGQDIVAAFAPIPGTNWKMVTEADWAARISEVRRYSNFFLLSLGTGLMVPPLGILVLRRQRRFRLHQRKPPEVDDHLARVIHQELSPSVLPALPGWTVRAECGLPGEMGGCFYDLHLLPDGKLMISLGQVQERGLHAAIALTTARALLRNAGELLQDSHEALTGCNRLLAGGFERPMSLTCLLLTLDPLTGEVEYSNAGEFSPLLCDGRNPPRAELPLAPPLGVDLNLELHSGSGVVPPGGCLLLLSRAAAAAQDAAGARFGPNVLPELLLDSSGDSLADRIVFEYEELTSKSIADSPMFSLILLQRRTANDEQV